MSATRQQSGIYKVFKHLLANIVVKRASTMSVAAAHAAALAEYNRGLYIIRLLEQADYETRLAVANDARASNSPGQIQLAGILDIYETLTPQRKRAFIDAYKTAGTVRGQGAVKVALATTYQPGHVPPQFVP